MKNLSTQQIIVTLMAASASLLSTQAFAAGYGLHEVSPSLMGNAYAGNSTSDEDITAMRFNPAVLAMADDHQIYLSATGIFPAIDASNVRSNVEGALTVPGDPDPIPFSVSEGPTQATDVGSDAFVPAAFFAFHVNDAVNLGLAVTGPWGLSTQYDDDWTGRYFGIGSELKTVNINPMASLRFDEHFSIAAGFQAQYMNAQLTQRTPIPTVGLEPIPVPPFAIPIFAGISDLYTKVKGHGWGYGWSLGGLYEFTEDTRIGLGFQSKISTTIEGNAESNGPSTPGISGGANAQAPFFTGDASTKVTTPEVVNLGISHDFNQCWTLMANVEWTHWSLFDELDVEIEGAGGEVHNITVEEWKNSYYYSVGADYRPMRDLVLRFGVGYDQSPVQSENRNPTIPDSDRNIYSVGAGYNFTDDLRIDIAYMYLRFHDTNVNLNDVPVTSFEDKSMSADYTGHANLVSIGLEYLF